MKAKISGCYILTPKLKVRKKDGIIIGDSFDVYKVDPETVCQYINENDKDNKMIFKNDIVKISTFKPQRMVIRFLDGAFCLTNKQGKYMADIHYIHHAGINNTKVTGNVFDGGFDDSKNAKED